MEKVNVSVDLQIRISHSFNEGIMAVNNDTIRVFIRTNKGVSFVDLDDNGKVSDGIKCELVSDLDSSDSWFKRVGSGKVNSTNIRKAYKMIKENKKK